MAFENPLQGMMDSASEFFNSLSGNSKLSLQEMEELCRDEESSGCDVEMMDALMAAQAKKDSAQKGMKPRWSAEIDDAVFKTD